MVARTSWRYLRHSVGGAIGVPLNALVYLIMRLFEIAPNYQTIIPFVVAGQVAFWVHDRWTYRDRHPHLEGWIGRWLWFMPGQLGGGALNLLVAEHVTYAYDWPMASVYMCANIAGSLVSFAWTNFVSHREPDSSESPDGSRKES